MSTIDNVPFVGEQEAIAIWNLCRISHALSVAKGWWDDFPTPEDRNKGELIALMHSELSEALEALRHGNPPDDKVPELAGDAAEMADCVIRIFDYCGAFNIDLGEAIRKKHAFNKTRSHKHGGKKF